MEIKPFRAFRFSKVVVGDVGSCISPPYDVINEIQQQQLYNSNDYNVVRIIKPQSKPSNGQADNVYTRAAGYFGDWIKQGALKQDSAESVYAYVQDFELAGAWFRRFSFIALGKLEPFGKIVHPHENTMLGPRKDRLELKKATAADFGLVFMLYDDPQRIADDISANKIDDEPLVDFNDDQNVRHRLFAVTDRDEISAIINMFGDKSCIIADGHHRYETGLAYYELTGNPAAQYQMMAFTNTSHEGLIVLATHRLVSGLEKFSFDDLIGRLKKDFEVIRFGFDSPDSARKARHQMFARMKADYAKDRSCFGIYGGDGAFYVAKLVNKSQMEKAAPRMSEAWRKLDVTVLSKLVLDRILGITDEKLAGGANVSYIKDSGSKSKELVKQIDAGDGQVVFFMNPPKIEHIKAVADAGERMPQKSTYFYPKVFTGLTIYKLP
ncbi:MAG: DUF1015 domain-containing protein [Phycisphaerae bacterium]|jgi:uncharacterized protein (DUF1015 family)